MSKDNKKKDSFFLTLIKSMFGGKSKKELDIMQEEAIQSPLRTVIKNFIGNKLAMTGLIVFLLIFATVIIGPFFYPITMNDREDTQVNVAPGMNLMDIPKELAGNVKDIAVGSTFSIGVDNNGKVYVWGKTKITNTVDILKDMPSQDKLGKVVDVAAGFDHVMVLNDKGKVICWGNNRLKQCTSTLGRFDEVVQIEAGYQMSFALTAEGKVVYWGNENLNDVVVNEATGDGNIAKIAVCNTTLMALTKDGQVVHMGLQKNDLDRIPENVKDVKDIVCSANTVIATLEDGSLVPWGQMNNGQGDIPQIEGDIVSMYAGRYHFTALTDKGTVYSWGFNNKGQTNVPKDLANVKAIYGGSYQNYAVTESNKLESWGLKGYLMGTDELGRDVFARLLNGGKMTMTIGAISVIISTILAIIIGGISGFFGGMVDILLQRLTEIVSSLPFLPMAMILTAIIGNSMTETERIALIMVILGLLSWPSLAKLIRAQVLAEREKEFVTAATAMGVKKTAIIFKHIIPNVISVIIVSATLDFATCMLTESSLSYLGFGVKLPRPTWGNMLNGCVNSVVIQNYWWRWVFPAIALSICVICINMIGDGLRNAIDPKSNER